MKRVIDTSEVLGRVEESEATCDLCASADACFDEDAGRLVVRLKSFLRTTDLLTKERQFRASWLPEDKMVSETVSLDDCDGVARDIFHRWVRKVREAAPQLPAV
jgi:hypothetical protein